jgi:ABC-2 type transport system ATP-binding protein
MCDHIAMIDHGKIILHGPLNEIKKKYAQRNVSLNYEGDISFLRNNPIIQRMEDFGNTTGIKVKENFQIQELLKLLVQNDVVVNSFKANEISLHEIFVQLAGAEDGDSREVEHV